MKRLGDVPDYLREHGARELIFRLQRYWAARGQVPEFRIEKLVTSSGQETFAVRSDMVNGMPQTPAVWSGA